MSGRRILNAAIKAIRLAVEKRKRKKKRCCSGGFVNRKSDPRPTVPKNESKWF